MLRGSSDSFAGFKTRSTRCCGAPKTCGNIQYQTPGTSEDWLHTISWAVGVSKTYPVVVLRVARLTGHIQKIVLNQFKTMSGCNPRLTRLLLLHRSGLSTLQWILDVAYKFSRECKVLLQNLLLASA